MQYQSDYVLRLVEQMGGLIRRALILLREGDGQTPYELSEEAISLALDIDPALVTKLSPQSLASLIEMNNLDDRVVELVAEALKVQADALDNAGEIIGARMRREQAATVLSLLDPNRAN